MSVQDIATLTAFRDANWETSYPTTDAQIKPIPMLNKVVAFVLCFGRKIEVCSLCGIYQTESSLRACINRVVKDATNPMPQEEKNKLINLAVYKLNQFAMDKMDFNFFLIKSPVIPPAPVNLPAVNKEAAAPSPKREKGRAQIVVSEYYLRSRH